MRRFPRIIPAVVTWLFCLMLCTHLQGQDTTLSGEYQSAPLPEHSFDKKDWKELTKDLDYRQKEPGKKKEFSPSVKLNPIDLGDEVKILMYIVVAIAIAFLLYLLLGKDFLRWIKKKRLPEEEISIRSLEEDPGQAPLEELLAWALKEGDYKLAVRVYFLMTVRALQHSGRIQWRKYKTNAHYLSEMRGQADFADFAKIVALYEEAWFSNRSLSKEEFDPIREEFSRYLKTPVL